MTLDVLVPMEREYGFRLNYVIRELAMKKGGLIGAKWVVAVSVFECPCAEDENHENHSRTDLTVLMSDGTGLRHAVTLHLEDIETRIDQHRLSAWENQEPAWPLGKTPNA